MRHVLFTNVNNFDLPIIEKVLKKNKISFFIKSTYESSINAGWMTPTASFNEQMLFVDAQKLDKVKQILGQYIRDYNP